MYTKNKQIKVFSRQMEIVTKIKTNIWRETEITGNLRFDRIFTTVIFENSNRIKIGSTQIIRPNSDLIRTELFRFNYLHCYGVLPSKDFLVCMHRKPSRRNLSWKSRLSQAKTGRITMIRVTNSSRLRGIVLTLILRAWLEDFKRLTLSNSRENYYRPCRRVTPMKDPNQETEVSGKLISVDCKVKQTHLVFTYQKTNVFQIIQCELLSKITENIKEFKMSESRFLLFFCFNFRILFLP